MSVKTKSIGALFVALAIILAVNPKIVNNIYGSILGRLFLIAIVIFFSLNNVTLGLLVALAVISSLNQYGSFVEGFEAPVTIGEENVPITGKQQVLTKTASEEASKQKISDLKTNIANGIVGVDKEDIKNTIMPKNSKSIQIDPSVMKSDEVNAHSPNTLTKVTGLTESFCPYAASV